MSSGSASFIRPVKVLPDANYAFTLADSGTIFQLGTVSAARTHSLPAVASSAGMEIKVVVTVAPAGNAVTFQAPVGLMFGLLTTVVTAASPGVPTIRTVGNAAARSVVTGANTAVGSSLTLWCDGSSWQANAIEGANAAAGWAFA